MLKRVSFILPVLVLLLLAPLAVSAQQQQPTFTFVSEWTIPRAQWAEWVAFGEKNAKPIFEKFAADGTIIGWGIYSTTVHEENQATHGSWFETRSIAGIDKVLAEVAKLPPNPIVNAPTTKHRDFLLRSQIRNARAGSGSNGYLWVNYTQVQPGKFDEWRELFNKYIKPTFEELVSSGAFVTYAVLTEQIHTQNPNGVYLVYVTPNADGIDKFLAAIAARAQKGSPEERRAIGEAFAALTVGSAHRDFFARINYYSIK